MNGMNGRGGSLIGTYSERQTGMLLRVFLFMFLPADAGLGLRASGLLPAGWCIGILITLPEIPSVITWHKPGLLHPIVYVCSWAAAGQPAVPIVARYCRQGPE